MQVTIAGENNGDNLLTGGEWDVATGTLAPTAITGVPSLQQWKVPANVVAPPALTTTTELSP